jgi:DNA-binding CsgD family transcriptional regulator
MPDRDLFMQTVEAAYASGFTTDRLPDALTKLSRLVGGVGAALEVIDKKSLQTVEFHSIGLPKLSIALYNEQFAPLNPRVPHLFRQPPGKTLWDYQVFDEADMNSDPFFDFLGSLGLRYALGTLVENSPDKLVALSVKRTKKQGHPGKREIALMDRLNRHFQQAYDVAQRIGAADDHRVALENALNWVADGVALLRADGEVVYASDMIQTLARRGDGFRIINSSIEFSETEARRCYAAAIGAVARAGNPSSDAIPTDFAAARTGGAPAYIVSVRPILGVRLRGQEHASIMVFVRDPLWRNAANGKILQELFGLTNAEAHLAHALCTGATTTDYARERRVTINTVYSHLKRIREKTGCSGVPDLIRKFGEFNVPLRLR